MALPPSGLGDFGHPDIRNFFNAPQGACPSGANPLGELFLLGPNGALSPVQSKHGGGTDALAHHHHGSSVPPPTLVGTAGGLQFKLIWDASVASAPTGFMNAAITAA